MHNERDDSFSDKYLHSTRQAAVETYSKDKRYSHRVLTNHSLPMKQRLHTLFVILILSTDLIRVFAHTPTSVSGRVLGYLSNRIGDYDGLRLQTSVGEAHLLFPPHTASRILKLAATGQRIQADVEPQPGRPELAQPGLGGPGETTETDRSTITTYRLIRLRNQTLGTSFQLADLPPPPPRQGQLIQTEGPLVSKIHSGQGQLTALLTDKYLIELKPHQVEQISSLLTGVQRLGVTGFERTADGFVNRTGRPVLHPTTLTIRGQTFAL